MKESNEKRKRVKRKNKLANKWYLKKKIIFLFIYILIIILIIFFGSDERAILIKC